MPTKFCNGTTVTCDGLSQWGSQELAQQGLDFVSILRRYYGNDIEIVVDAPIQDIRQSYPGAPLRLGSVGESVVVLQTMLNRISRNYPAIPKVPATGAFDEDTEEAVRVFQRVFGLTPDGVVGKATWYEMVYLYVGVLRLAELVSEGQTFYRVQFQYPGVLREGDRGGEVRILQYMLALLAEFDNTLLPIQVDGVYGPATTQAVRQYQNLVGLRADGIAGETTWKSLYQNSVRADYALRNDTVRAQAGGGVQTAGQGTSGTDKEVRVGQYPGRELTLGHSDGRVEVMV